MEETPLRKREISVSTCFDYSVPIGRQLALIAGAGFTHVSIGARCDHSGILAKDGQERLLGLLSETGLRIDTLHGVDLDRPDAMRRSGELAEICQTLRIHVIVLHCSAFDFAPEEYERRLEPALIRVKELEQLAKASGVRFALENVAPGAPARLLEAALRASDPALIGFCCDASHDQIGGPRELALLENLKSRLIAVHLSDRIRDFTDHVLPGEGFIDFAGVCGLIGESPFAAPLLFEVMTEHSGFKQPELFLREAYRRGCALYDQVFG